MDVFWGCWEIHTLFCLKKPPDATFFSSVGYASRGRVASEWNRRNVPVWIFQSCLSRYLGRAPSGLLPSLIQAAAAGRCMQSMEEMPTE